MVHSDIPESVTGDFTWSEDCLECLLDEEREGGEFLECLLLLVPPLEETCVFALEPEVDSEGEEFSEEGLDRDRRSSTTFSPRCGDLDLPSDGVCICPCLAGDRGCEEECFHGGDVCLFGDSDSDEWLLDCDNIC